MQAIDEVFRREYNVEGLWELKQAVVVQGQEIRIKIIADYFE